MASLKGSFVQLFSIFVILTFANPAFPEEDPGNHCITAQEYEAQTKARNITATHFVNYYGDIFIGSGASPSTTSLVKVKISGFVRGSLTEDRKTTVLEFRMNDNKIGKGITTALRAMRVGGKATVWIPAEMATGIRELWLNLKPKDQLVLELELISVVGDGQATVLIEGKTYTVDEKGKLSKEQME